MSILKVDTINEKTSGNGVAIPGHVVQVVQQEGNKTSSQGFGSSTIYTSTSYVSVDQAALTITPKFASSKILLLLSNHLYAVADAANDWRGARLRIQRGSTDIITDGNAYGESMYLVGDSDRWMTHMSTMVYDSPNTTSATTYTLQVSSKLGTQLYMNRLSYGSGGFFLAMEIAQ